MGIGNNRDKNRSNVRCLPATGEFNGSSDTRICQIGRGHGKLERAFETRTVLGMPFMRLTHLARL